MDVAKTQKAARTSDVLTAFRRGYAIRTHDLYVPNVARYQLR